MHNLDSELMIRYAKNISSILNKVYGYITYVKLRRYESKCINKFDLIFTCSKDDAVKLSSSKLNHINVVPNGVDRNRFSLCQGKANKNAIVFTGSLDYHANINGLIWFIREVFPIILSINPEIVFNIVGKNPERQLVNLIQDYPTIKLFPDVPDTKKYLCGAKVVVVPLLVGGGTRLKILEAMSVGRPVVSTSLGCEGILVQNSRDIIIADNPKEFARSVCNLLNDNVAYNEIVNNALITIKDYDWIHVYKKINEIYSKLILEKK
jgi:glycosyltransferase involved in cell wall biosynthesis